MCVPGPGLLAEEGPRAWPGRVRVGVDMIVLSVWFGGGGVARMRCDLKVHLGKVESDVCARRRVRVRESTWVSFNGMRGWINIVENISTAECLQHDVTLYRAICIGGRRNGIVATSQPNITIHINGQPIPSTPKHQSPRQSHSSHRGMSYSYNQDIYYKILHL